MQRDIAATVGEVLAEHRRNIAVFAEAVARDAPLRANLDPFEAAPQDEIDHTGNRVGTVDGGARAGDDVGALDQVGRYAVDVGRHRVVEDVGGDMAAAIDQNQRACGAHAAQIQQAQAGDADARARILLAKCAAQLRQVVQVVADAGVAGLEELVAGDRRDRSR